MTAELNGSTEYVTGLQPAAAALLLIATRASETTKAAGNLFRAAFDELEARIYWPPYVPSSFTRLVAWKAGREYIGSLPMLDA